MSQQVNIQHAHDDELWTTGDLTDDGREVESITVKGARYRIELSGGEYYHVSRVSTHMLNYAAWDAAPSPARSNEDTRP